MLIIARYHEIALKGRNRPFFVDKLARNLRRATSDIGGKVQIMAGRVGIEVPDETPWETVRERMGNVFGIANFSRTRSVPLDMTALEEAVVASLSQQTFESFRVTARRSYKNFAMNSGAIDRALGAAVQKATGVRVNLEEPDINVFVEVLRDRILYSFERCAGAGGFPVGSSGRVMALMSGGIDSPVAVWRLMKRGCTVIPVHFHAFPLQDHTTIDKTMELARVLTQYQYKTRLLLVPFGEAQQTIVASCPQPLRVVLYRRFMVRIAEALAVRNRAKALVTGESLGQVASQTLDNIAAIDDAATLPVLRPLIGMDKDEITREARRIGTFEISTLPDQDCCQLFTPRSPATAATVAEVVEAEKALDVASLVATAVEATRSEIFTFPTVTL